MHTILEQNLSQDQIDNYLKKTQAEFFRLQEASNNTINANEMLDLMRALSQIHLEILDFLCHNKLTNNDSTMFYLLINLILLHQIKCSEIIAGIQIPR